MTTPNAEFMAQVAEAVRAERAARIDILGREAMLWLAAVPLWTASAAEVTGFPASSVRDFVTRARDAGWCETRGSLREQAAGELLFWMPDEHRRSVLDLLIRQDGQQRVYGEAAGIARQLSALSRQADGDGDVMVPGALRYWASLMKGEADLVLVIETRRAVEAGDLGSAQELVSAGEAVAALRAGAMELALDRARRLLGLGMRRRQDGRALERYLDRPELSGAVTRLLLPDADQWALHLRGVGGVGKTMVIRYLASGRFAADRRMNAIPIARVDFDHMSPDYPVRRPVQLLLELADELALSAAAAGSADRALSRFRATAASVHESLSGVREERPDPMRNPRVLAAADAFAEVTGQLPGVLLILDTCEELAKADAGDPAAPAVRTTLAILERIHDRAPSVRVLFAGRRPLPARSYLGVQDVTGFTLEEARRYLSAFSSTPLADDLAEEMIRQSPAVDAGIPASGELPARMSPFDLALYLAWADEDPRLDARRVAQGSDAYIEGRIIERLRDPAVLAALPVLACAGRSRVATIASFTGRDAAVLGPRLAEQEWIDSDGDPPLHVTAKPALARKLLHYFGAQDRAARFAEQAGRLARALRDTIAAAPLDDIDTDELLAALRLSGPADAARLWDGLADRAAAAGRWSWLLEPARRVLGESEEEEWPTASALRATVLAAYIAASRRGPGSFNTRAAWQEVRAWADRHPDPTARRFLSVRAALGVLPAPDDAPAWDVIRSGLGRDSGTAAHRLELAAAAADTGYRLLEAGARDAAKRIARDGLLSSALRLPRSDRAGMRVTAWLFVAIARLLAEDDDRQGALDSFAQAEAAAMAAAAAGHATAETAGQPGMADWIPPDDLLARVRLERGLIAPPEGDVLDRWESHAADRVGTIDGERLASLCLRTRLGNGIIEPSVIQRWEAIDSYEPDRVATCSAHDLVPPLCVTLADAWLAAGDPRRALDLIERRRAAALDTRDDDVTVRLADAATVRIARRLRLDDQRALLARLSGAADRDPDLANSAWRAMAVVYGEPPPPVGEDAGNQPASWHAWWQCQTSGKIAPPRPRWPPGSTGTELAAEIELDTEEMRHLENAARDQLLEELADWLARPRPAPHVRSADPYRDARADLRRAALAGDQYPKSLAEVPPRLLAEMAFDEAELLALRFPDTAAQMFLYAHTAYGSGGDLIGQLLAAISRADIIAGWSGDAVTQTALEALTASRPDVAAALTGPVQRAGPWRYWAERLQRLWTREVKRLPVVVTASLASRIASWIDRAFSISLGIAGLVVLLIAAYGAAPAAFLAGVLSLLGVLLTAVVATGTWRLREVARLADGRAAGVFSPTYLGFSALIGGTPGPDPRDRVYLWVGLRSLWVTPKRRWPRLAVMCLVVGLAALLRQKAQYGYSAIYNGSSEGEGLSWETERPEADRAWWLSGTASGVISMNPADAIRPWERIITASLGLDAAGCIQWYRAAAGFRFWARRPADHGGTGVALEAPPGWLRSLRGSYDAINELRPRPADSPIRIRHAIGRAVSTSAGPRLDVSGEQAATSSARELLGADTLTSGRPSMLILQAEPAPGDAAVMGQLDDLIEKLALAVDVTETGAACDVLIVPALPARLMTAVTQAIAAYAVTGRHGDPRLVQAELRRLLGPGVPPAILDDLILFMNARYQ